MDWKMTRLSRRRRRKARHRNKIASVSIQSRKAHVMDSLPLISCFLVTFQFCYSEDATSQRNLTAKIGEFVSLRCEGNSSSDILIKVAWRKNINPLISCSYGQCDSASGYVFYTEGKYFSNFTLRNVSLEDENIYDCKIHQVQSTVTCLFFLKVEVPPDGLIIQSDPLITHLQTKPVKVRAGIPKNLTCQTRQSVKPSVNLNWVADELHGTAQFREDIGDESDDRLVVSSVILSFIPTAADDGKLLTCLMPDYNGDLPSLNTSVTLRVEECVSNVEIANCHQPNNISNDQLCVATCITDTANIRLIASVVNFIISNGYDDKTTVSSWDGDEVGIARYTITSDGPSYISCCTSRTPFCPPVCSNVCVIVPQSDCATPNENEVTTVGDLSTYQSGIVTATPDFQQPAVLWYSVGSLISSTIVIFLIINVICLLRRKRKKVTSQPTEQRQRGELPPIPTGNHLHNETAHSTEVLAAQPIRYPQSQTQLQLTLPPSEDEMQKRSNSLMGEFSCEGSSARKRPLDPSVVYAAVNKITKKLPLDPEVEYAVVDKTSKREKRNKGKISIGSSKTKGPLDSFVVYATVDKKHKSCGTSSISLRQQDSLDPSIAGPPVEEVQLMKHGFSGTSQKGPLNPFVIYASVNKNRSPSKDNPSATNQVPPLDPSVEYATLDKHRKAASSISSPAPRGSLDSSVEYLYANLNRI